MSIQSFSESEGNLCDFIFEYLQINLKYDFLEKQYISHNRYNIILIKGRPDIFFSTHLDTVPGNVGYKYENGKIYGRGACDAKGQIITQLWAVEELIKNGLTQYGLLFVVGEETDNIGARTAIESKLVQGALLLNGEPTDCHFVSSSWGIIEVILSSKGEARHSSITEARSAIKYLCEDIISLLAINDKKILLNVGTIKGGIASNIIADSAVANICVRFSGEVSQIVTLIKNHINSSSIIVKDMVPEFKFHVPTFSDIKSKEVFFCSDAPLFQKKFDKIMLFGPGSIKYAHADDEHMDITDIHKAKNIICNVVSNILLK